MSKHRYKVHTLHWRSITIEVTYEADWLFREGFYCPCHLTLKSIAPDRCPLPVTETGYLSHFTDPVLIEKAGGPLAYVVAELEAAAKSAKWRKHEVGQRQPSLF